MIDRAVKFGNDELGCTNAFSVRYLSKLTSSGNTCSNTFDFVGCDQILEDCAMLYMAQLGVLVGMLQSLQLVARIISPRKPD